MTRSAHTLLAPLAVFGAVLALLTLVNRLDAPAPVEPAAAPVAGGVAGRVAGDRVRELQAAIAADPGGAPAYAALGEAFLQRARETGDPAFYARAGRAFAAGLRRRQIGRASCRERV